MTDVIIAHADTTTVTVDDDNKKAEEYDDDVLASSPLEGDLEQETSVTTILARAAVTLYDLTLRVALFPSFYLMMNGEKTVDEFMKKRMHKSTRRYLEHGLEQSKMAEITSKVTGSLGEEEMAFSRRVFLEKHKDHFVVFFVWSLFVRLIAADARTRITVSRNKADGRIVGVFVEFLAKDMHYFITALVDHEASKDSGLYLAKYRSMIAECLERDVPILRLGPKAESLKTGLGAVPLPLFVVGSPVWARLVDGAVSVVSFGIFSSLALAFFLFLTQVNLDLTGVGSLTVTEIATFYFWCMAFCKILPFVSLGRAFFVNPLKYLKQTSFYAQGVIVGLVPALCQVFFMRGAHPALFFVLCDALSKYTFVAEAIGRLGCHFYGCCFGKPANMPCSSHTTSSTAASTAASPPPPPSSSPSSSTYFARFGVAYVHHHCAASRLRPEYQNRILLPTQLCQSLFALVSFAIMLWVDQARLFAANGLLFSLFLFLYSFERIFFFFWRDDEAFKKAPSYTTLYLSLASLAFAFVFAIAALWSASSSSSSSSSSHLSLAPRPVNWSQHFTFALTILSINMVVQGLHDGKAVGRFPGTA